MFNPLHYLMKLKARKELRKNRADLYYDIATSLEDRVPLFTTFRKYEARARRRKPGRVLPREVRRPRIWPRIDRHI